MLTSTAPGEGGPVGIFTIKYREEKLESRVGNEKLKHTKISPMNIQGCSWEEERENQTVQTAAPGHQEKKEKEKRNKEKEKKKKTVKQQKKPKG